MPPIWNIKSFEELSLLELYAILRLRAGVFVVEQNATYQDLDDTDQLALHLWGEVGGQVVAYCRLFPTGIKHPECSIGRVVSPKNARGNNYGKSLMNIAIDCIETRFSTKEIRISAQDYLLNFYSEFGFVATAKAYLEDGIPHTEMFRS